jgi:hypothetical protein
MISFWVDKQVQVHVGALWKERLLKFTLNHSHQNLNLSIPFLRALV